MSRAKRQGETQQIGIRDGRAKPKGKLVDNKVHVFVDDQNLFWGIVNSSHGPGFRIDFGRLTAASRDSLGGDRFAKTAFIAGVIPDDADYGPRLERAISKGWRTDRSPGSGRQCGSRHAADASSGISKERMGRTHH